MLVVNIVLFSLSSINEDRISVSRRKTRLKREGNYLISAECALASLSFSFQHAQVKYKFLGGKKHITSYKSI